MGNLKKYLQPYWAFIFLTVLIKLLGAVLELLIPYFMEIMIDYKVPEGLLQQIYLYGGLMILCALGGLGCHCQPHERHQLR